MNMNNINENENENVREEIRNEIILQMRHHLDETTLSILKQVLAKTLSNV